MKRLFSLVLTVLALSAFTTIPLEMKKGKITMVVDAGHGGKDPGNNAQGINESDVNLQIALALKNVKKKKGIEIIYTRKDDSFLELHDRTNIAQDKNADLLISVHCDNYSDEDLAGDHLLAETVQPLQKLLQAPKKLHLPLERPNLKASSVLNSAASYIVLNLIQSIQS